MSKKSNPTIIGAFVVGAVLLLAIGVAVFGGAELFAKRNVYVAYFSENAKGLRVGSNVMMNGVQIGQVSRMRLFIEQDGWESLTEVTMEILPESYIPTRDGVVIGEGPDVSVAHDVLINEAGLRATLQAESLVTGQLAIQLQFRADTPAEMRGGSESPYPEIPTMPSNIQQLLTNVQTFLGEFSDGVNATELAEHISNILQGVDKLVNSDHVQKTLAGVDTLVNSPATQELTATLQSTLREVRSAAGDASSLLRDTDVLVEDDIKPVIQRMTGALDEAQQALAAAKFQLRGDSVQVYQLGETLREVEGAARAMREFLDYLEQNPEALLKGKKQ